MQTTPICTSYFLSITTTHQGGGGGRGETCIGPETRVLTTQEPTSENENSTIIQIKDLCNKPKPAIVKGDIVDASH